MGNTDEQQVEGTPQANEDAPQGNAGPVEDETPTDDASDAQEGAEDATEGTEGEEPEGSDDDLPAWARKKLTRANNEAASYRTQLRAAQDKLEGSKTIEEFEAATAELRQQIDKMTHESLVREVALAKGLPPALADRLKGSTREELEADAQGLLSVVAKRNSGGPFVGGVSGSGTTGPVDPVEAAAEVKRLRYRR